MQRVRNFGPFLRKKSDIYKYLVYTLLTEGNFNLLSGKFIKRIRGSVIIYNREMFNRILVGRFDLKHFIMDEQKKMMSDNTCVIDYIWEMMR